MKNQSKLCVCIPIASLLAVVPLAIAEDTEVVPEIAICPFPIQVCPEIPIHIDPMVVDPTVVTPTDAVEPAGGEVKPDDEGEALDHGDVVTEVGVGVTIVDEDSAPGDEGIPIDWVKRGGGEADAEHPEIYYGMAGPGQQLLEKGGVSNSVSREPVKDDRAAAIETRANATTPQVMVEKKEPVALIKKGRVFLR